MLQKTTIKWLVVISLSFIAISSCEKDNSPVEDKGDSGEMTCKVEDGSKWQAATFQNTLLLGTDSGFDSKRLDIRGTAADGSQLILTVTDTRDGKVGEGFRIDTIYGKLALNEGNYMSLCTLIQGATYSISTSSTEGFVYISECDTVNHTISGVFSFPELLPSNSITEGQFENLSYSVLRY